MTIFFAQDEAAAVAVALVLGVIYLAVIVLMIASLWKIFTKAGEDGWKAIIPIYNIIVLLQIVGRPVWWLVLFIIPIANFVVAILLAIDLAKSFGKDTGFAIGLILLGPVFYPILAFGDSRYIGPAGPEPRPGYAGVGQGGQQGWGAYGQQPQQFGQQPQQYGQQPPQWGQQPQQGGQQWGQQPQQGGQQWGQQPQQGGQHWGQQPQQDQQWGQQPPQGGQQPPQWGQPPQNQPNQPGSDQDYPPPPVS